MLIARSRPRPGHRRTWFAVLSLLSASLLVSGGCTERAAEESRAENTAAGSKQTAPGASGTGARDDYLALAADEIDTSNRYLSAVMVTAHVSMAERGEVECSGVLIGPRVVLTAGRCVCVRPKAAEAGEKSPSVINGSDCVTAVTVTTVAYEPPVAAEDLSYANKEYRGTVHPHPELKLMLDPQQGIASSRADLAVILLSKPVRNLIPIKLASTEVGAGESAVWVGYSRDETAGGMGRKRHLAHGKIAKSSTTGSGVFLPEPPSRQRLALSDTGGPCLRDNGEGAMLIGILSGASGEGVSFTSTYAHRAWLLSELQRAATH